MNTVEDRLRDALSERAEYSPIGPDAWERTVARTRRPSRARATAWSKVMIPVAAAAAVVAIVVAATALTGHGGPRGGSGATRPSPAVVPPAATPTPPGPDDYLIRMVPPVTAIVPVKLTVGGLTTWMFVWFGYDKSLGGLVLASEYNAVTAAGGDYGGSGTGLARLSAPQIARWCGEAGPIRTDTIRLGVAERQVGSVAAQLPGGRKIAGQLVSGRGFPYQVWAVSYPDADNATIVFRSASGRELGQLTILATPGGGQPVPYATFRPSP
jgi:hypothetical protein